MTLDISVRHFRGAGNPCRLFSVTRRLRLLVLIGLVFGWQPAGASSSGEMRVVFLDVGQGDSTFIRTPAGKTILVDGGGTPSWSKLSYDPGREEIVPFLRREGVKALDFVVISHPHGDHIGGFLEVFRRIPVRNLLDPGLDHDEPEYPALLKLAREKKTNYEVVGEGDVLNWDPALRVEVLAPSRDFEFTHLNDNSVVLKITYGEVSFLLTGDVEKEGEARLVKKHKNDLRADVLKVAHHGSRTSTTPRFIDAVRPKTAVISCGRNNLFKHPHPEVVSRLQSRGIKTYRTDLDGDVEIRTNGKHYRVDVQYEEP
jgi:competence protein ComEC